MLKDLYKADKTKDGEIVNHVNNAWNEVHRNETSENERPDKVIDIIEEILNFNKQQNGKERPSDKPTHIKILSLKQMLQRLPISLAQVKAGNTSENLLNEICRTIYYIYIYQVKEITKRVYNNLMNLINLKNRMDTIFMNSENNKTSEPHRLLLNLADKMNLKRSDKCVALSNLSMHYTWKNIKSPIKTINLKCHPPHGMKHLNYLKDCILYQIFKIILSASEKNMKKWLMILQ